MWQFLHGTIFPACITVSAGVMAWIATNFFADPLLHFYRTRTAIHESLFFTANVSSYRGESVVNAAREELRRQAATLSALAATSPAFVLAWYRWRGYSLKNAAAGLTGFSNSIDLEEGSKALHRNQIEKSLRFERSYDQDTLAMITKSLGNRRVSR